MIRTAPCMTAACLAAVLFSANASAQSEREGIVPERMQSWYDGFHFSPAIRAGDMVYLSGVVAGRPEGDAPDQAAYEANFTAAFEAITLVLNEAGADWGDVVEMTTFHVELGDETQRAAFQAVRDRYIVEPWPAWTAIGVERLWGENGLVEIRVTAYAPRDEAPDAE